MSILRDGVESVDLGDLIDVSIPTPVAGAFPIYDGGAGLYESSIKNWTIGEARTVGAALENTEDATAGTQQWSPILALGGRGFKNDVPTESRYFGFGWQTRPAASPGNPVGSLFWMTKTHTGAWTDLFFFSYAGGFYWAVDGTGEIGAGGSYRPNSVNASNFIRAGNGLRVGSDAGGDASSLTLVNATVAAGSNPPTQINAPAAAAQTGWLKIYIGTTAYAVPYWPAS